VKHENEVLPYVRQDFHRDVSLRRDQLLDFVVVVLSELVVTPPGSLLLEVVVDDSEDFSDV